MEQLIKIACHRTGQNWATKSSEYLADAIIQPHALRQMTLTEAIQLAVEAGGILAEYGRVYSHMNDEFVNALKTGLHNGDYTGVTILAEIAKSNVSLAWGQASKDAIDTVLSVNSLRLIDVVANERGLAPPEIVTSQDVSVALNRA